MHKNIQLVLKMSWINTTMGIVLNYAEYQWILIETKNINENSKLLLNMNANETISTKQIAKRKSMETTTCFLLPDIEYQWAWLGTKHFMEICKMTKYYWKW